MFKFHEGLYTDVRIEDIFETTISFKKKVLEEQKIRCNKGAFVRVYDGHRWYYSSTTSIKNIQDEIDQLSKMATPNPSIDLDPIVKKFEIHNDESIIYSDKSIDKIDVNNKRELLEKFFPMLQSKYIVDYITKYVDKKAIKTFYSSKGSYVKYDKQTVGVTLRVEIVGGDKKFTDKISKAFIYFDDIESNLNYYKKEIDKSIDFCLNSESIVPGEYTVVLSPVVAGVFTHESFGHKSESDFMVGDETMAKEWAIGKTVGSDILTIIDDGNVEGSGFAHYDDEGTKGKKTMIITKGKLTGRLHSTRTAALMEEDLTGNARAINFEFEPIVRMTTTYIEKGNRPKDEIISEIKNGIYVDGIKHGSGMSTFTLAPSRAYMIENGKITKPVKVSVITGNVFETLNLVDAVSSEFEILSFVVGGCGKMEQYPLPVGFGGPYVRVKKLNVQ